MRLLLDAGEGPARLRQVTAIGRIIRRDLQELRLYRQQLQQQQRRQREMESRRQRQRLLDLRLQREHHRLAGATRQQREAWQRLRRQRRGRAAKPPDPDQTALRRQIAAVERELPRSGGFARLRGRLPRPVAGRTVLAFGLVSDPRTKMTIPST